MGTKVIKYWYKSIPQEYKEVLGSSKFKISLSKIEKKELKDAIRILEVSVKEIFLNVNSFNRESAKEFLKLNLFSTLLKYKGINKISLSDFKSKKEVITFEKIFNEVIENSKIEYDKKLQEDKKNGRDISQKAKSSSTIGHQLSSFKYLKMYFGENKNIANITRQDAKRFQKFLTEKGLTNKTNNIYFLQINSVLNELVKDKIIASNEFNIKRLIQNDNTKDMFSNEDIKLILENLTGDYKTLFEFGIYTGMRISEILDIKIKNIEEDILFIPFSKNGSGRETIIHKNIKLNYGIITELKINDGEYINEYLLFKNNLKNRKYIQSKINEQIKKILLENNTINEKNKKKTFHSSRSSFRTFLENTTHKESFINDLMGHIQKGIGNKTYVKNRDINIKREIINSIDYSVENEA